MHSPESTVNILTSSNIWFCRINGIHFENMGFGIQFQNLGFGIGIWDLFSEYGIWDWDLGFIYKRIWDFRDFAEFSGISGIWDWDLILKIWDLGFDFENLGSGIGIWDSFTKNPGFGIPGSQIADPWTT